MHNYRILFVLVITLVIGSLSLLFSGNFSYQGDIQAGSWLRNIKVPYTFENVSSQGIVQIYFPKGYNKGDNARTLIVLHGYNFSMKSWEVNTNIRSFADKYGFVLVCPDMGRTLYEMTYYPETTNKWGVMPGGPFVGEVLVKFLRDTFNVANERGATGIMGLSTGARGAIMVAAFYNQQFGAAAGLSGDYDPMIMTNDKLLMSVYGDYDKFQERWEKDASAIYNAEKLKNVSVFLAHGGKDSVVSREQSVILAIRLKQLANKEGSFDVVFKEKRYKMHDWSYWSSMLPEMMKFFDEKLVKK